jgi:HAD superfamily hydrolase (TIGR01459 family)
MTIRHLPSLAPLAAEYDGFIVDLWGVIHDGVTPYPGAINCLSRLRAMGLPVVLLSNAPRRAHAAQQAMRAMGIEDGLYSGILTSGEATWRMLRDRSDPFVGALGHRVYHLGPERDRNVFDGLAEIIVGTPQEADYVLNTGPDDLAGADDPTAYDVVLRECADDGLPMICANPDLEVIRDGRRISCAGLITQRYECMLAARGASARTRWIGKPDAAIYGPVLQMLGVGRDRVLAVGDALRTDIAGAAAAGIAACWVLGGIHGSELEQDPERAEAAAHGAGLKPEAAIPAFIW